MRLVVDRGERPTPALADGLLPAAYGALLARCWHQTCARRRPAAPPARAAIQQCGVRLQHTAQQRTAAGLAPASYSVGSAARAPAAARVHCCP